MPRLPLPRKGVALVALSSALVLLAACDELFGPKLLPGTFALTSIDAVPLPAPMALPADWTAQGAAVTIVADTLVFEAHGWGERRGLQRARLTAGGAETETGYVLPFRYRFEASTILLDFNYCAPLECRGGGTVALSLGHGSGLRFEGVAAERWWYAPVAAEAAP